MINDDTDITDITEISKKSSIEDIKNQLEKYMTAKIQVHVVYKMKEGQKYKINPKTGEPMPRFHNGYITGKKSDDVYVIDERKLGQTYILVDDVFSVNVYAKSNETLKEEVKSKLRIGEGVSDDDIKLY